MNKQVVKYSGEPKFLPTAAEPIVACFEQVFGHPNLGNSKNVTSSRIIAINAGTIETMHTIYEPMADSENL